MACRMAVTRLGQGRPVTGHLRRAASRLGSRCRGAVGAAPNGRAGEPVHRLEQVDIVNKEVIRMDEKLYAYVLGRTREEPLLRDLRVETHELRGSRMQISPEQGQFMQQIVRMTRARRAIEVGVFTGYSALCTAMALPDGGELVACDNDADTMEIAKKYFEKAGVAAKVRCVVAPALETLAALLGDGQAGTFDLAFIDADKKRYKDYYELCLELVRPGGLVAVDNVLWYGRVADEADTKAPTLAIREFNDFAAADPRVDFTIVPIGDGVAMCLKR